MSTADVDAPPNVGSVTTLALTTLPLATLALTTVACGAVQSVDGGVGSVSDWAQAAATRKVVKITTRARHIASSWRTIRMRRT